MIQISAVLTGDLIASRKADAGQVDRAMTVLSRAAADFGAEWDIDLRFTRFRGDGWQAHLAEPRLVLDTVLFLIARLRAAGIEIDTRVSVGLGAVASTGTRDLSDASGAAFEIAGDHLDRIGKRRRLIVAGPAVGLATVALFDLMDFIAAGWSAAQAEAVSMALAGHNPTQEAIAGELGITRQAVQARLSAAGYAYLENALDYFRNEAFREAR